ncbi:MAG TPA: hypothetical protein VGH19_19525 [Verrucomicrobiae bacterium]
MALKLKQSQVWKLGNSYLRIVKLERLSVEYKDMPSPKTHLGTHHKLTKKEFCRLIKDAVLLNDKGVPPIAPREKPTADRPKTLPTALRKNHLPTGSTRNQG